MQSIRLPGSPTASRIAVLQQVSLYLRDGILAQTLWALELTRIYYGRETQRNYWTGCSQGGRQGFYMAENFPELFDGYLNGAPAIEINRFIQAEEWPTTITYTLPGHVLSMAKSEAARTAAIAACGADYGAGLGIIGEPRRCKFDAKSLICTGTPSDAPTCLTAQEADVINSIWKGPLDSHAVNLWGGIPKGSSFNTLLPGGTGPVGIVQTWPQNWVHQDPNYNVFLMTPSNFEADFETSYYKFENWAQGWGTDNTNLDGVRKRGAKIIHYHSSADPLTNPFSSYNYVTRVFDRYGVPETQEFLRSFYYPGNGHCGGGTGPQINTQDLFTALQNWVENGTAPDHIVASGTVNGSTPITRPICKYPDESVYGGSGSIYDASNFRCVVHNQEPADLAALSRSNHDHPETDIKLRSESDSDRPD
jgi:Tannase and feruloyl esterase